MRACNFDLAVEASGDEDSVEVFSGFDKGVRVGDTVFGCGQVLVAYGDGDNRGGRNEGCDAGGEPLVRDGGVRAEVGDELVLYGDDEVNAGVREGIEDFRVGVVDFYFVDES